MFFKMLRVLILCVFLQLVLSKNIEINQELRNEKDVMKKPLQDQKSSNNTFTQSLFSENNDNSNNGDDSIDEFANLNQTRRARVMKWFKQLLLTTKPPLRTKKITNVARNNDNNENLTLLNSLVYALDDLNKNLKRTNPVDYLTLKVPFKNERKSRYKRNVYYKNIKNDTENLSGLDSNNITAVNNSDTAGNVTENRYHHNDENRYSATAYKKIYNESSSDEASLSHELPIFLPSNSTLNIDPGLNGRRLGVKSESSANTDEIERLFNGIEQRIRPLTKLKISLSEDYSYRIGYIIANIDTLQIQLTKWKLEIYDRIVKGNDKGVYRILDKVKEADDVTSSLMAILAAYTQQ